MWQKFYPAQRKPCLCQRVSVCPWWGILTACLMPWTSRGISIGIASGVCVVFAIYGWSIYRPWFGALATLRNGRALLQLFRFKKQSPLRKLCLRREETSRRTTDEFQRLNIFKMFKAQRNVLIHLDPSTWLGVSMRICSFYRLIMLGWVLYIVKLYCLYP